MKKQLKIPITYVLALKQLLQKKHMPYLCWIYNEDIQKEVIGIISCAIDMSNALPTDKGDHLLIAQTSDYDCRFILQYLKQPKPKPNHEPHLQNGQHPSPRSSHWFL